MLEAGGATPGSVFFGDDDDTGAASRGASGDEAEDVRAGICIEIGGNGAFAGCDAIAMDASASVNVASASSPPIEGFVALGSVEG